MINKVISQILPHMPEKLVWQFSKEYIAGKQPNRPWKPLWS